eukprot:11208392-Lingulodinium_polyedra.AAC.1
MRRGGPVANVYRSMQSLGLGNDFQSRAPDRTAPDGWRPLARPRATNGAPSPLGGRICPT